MSALDDLWKKGLIEKIEPDQATATGWLDDAGRHLEATTKIAELDPSGAYVLAHAAARKSVAAALLMAGHRVLSRPGSHQALAQYAESIAIQVDEPALTRVDRLRRNRNQSEYGSRSFGNAEIAGAIDTAHAIRAACASLT